ncbi:isochorismatase family protein [Caballeronia ptereochthonis]|uniref:Isochorismatase hydrolase n=1 Tax=Caballeronia ptereochthonis TaxID=1777144 RepID=A0A158E4Y6_9BURK|nr:isochorismatase family protein [Caballeronia ptereochthonis]SAL01909.1 isochorismatase hydrolase [Caballeronia ptereochthonis]
MLVVIDMQARLLPHLDGGERLTERVATLLRAANLLDVPAVVTEQNPVGLGGTVNALLPVMRTANVIGKHTFDATLEPAFVAALPPAPATLWIVGAEAHVCVLLTVLGLLQLGYRVECVADAVASRRAADRAVALERARQEGAKLTTVETAIFGWLGSCRHPRFREALALVK